MLESITNALGFVIAIIGDIVSNFLNTVITSEWLKEGFVIGICVAVIFMAVKLIRSTIWGS